MSLAAFRSFLLGRKFLIVQLIIYVWYSIRRSAVLRLPWAILTSLFCVPKAQIWQQATYFLLEKRGQPLQASGVYMAHCDGKAYCVANEKRNTVEQLIGLYNSKSHVFVEYLRSGLPWAVARECNIHEAMCKVMEGYCIVEYNPLEKFVIERFPLVEDDWKSKLMQGIPIALSSLNLPLASAIASFALLFLDFSYYVWLDYFMLFAKVLKRLFHAITIFVPFTFKYACYMPISWVWGDFMPYNPYTLTLELKEVDMFYIKEGFWTNRKDFTYSDIDIKAYPSQVSSTFTTTTKCFDCQFRVVSVNQNHIELICRFKRIAFNLGEVKFSVRLPDYNKIMTLLELCMGSSLNLVRQFQEKRLGPPHLQCFDHIDLMQTILEPFHVKRFSLGPPVLVFIG